MHRHELEEPLRRNKIAWQQGVSFTWSIDSRDEGKFLGRIDIRQEPVVGEWVEEYEYEMHAK